MQLWLERTVARWADRDLRWTQAIHSVARWPVVILALVIVSRLANGLLWYTLIIVFPLMGGLTGTACAILHWKRAFEYLFGSRSECQGNRDRDHCLSRHS